MLKFLSTAMTPPSKDNRGWSYYQQELDLWFRSLQWDDLIRQIETARRAMNLDLSDGWRGRVEDEMCSYNDSPSHDPEDPKPFERELVKVGRRLWHELHGYRPAVWRPDEAKAWFRSWCERVPNFSTCSCRANLDSFLAQFPPRYGSPEEFHFFGEVLHDAVNAHLGKPLFRSV